MAQEEPYSAAALSAEKVILDQRITSLPINPIALAKQLGFTVVAKPTTVTGVSGMFIRVGESYGIAYATHIDNIGFQHFSVAHELGHYFLPGHIDAVLAHSHVHESRAGFSSGDQYELEADHFAARLLMPKKLFTTALRAAGSGFSAIEQLSSLCNTSLTATAIRFTQCTRAPVAIVVSTGNNIDYCFMSDTLKDFPGIDWIRKRQAVPRDTPTFGFNQDAENVRLGERIQESSELQDWFGGRQSIELMEEAVGLGKYGKTLTVLSDIALPDDEEDDDDDEETLIESWKPRFKG